MSNTDLVWKEEYDSEHTAGSPLYVLMHDKERIATISRKMYTREFHVHVVPMHIEKEFNSMDLAKNFAEDCARQCSFEWATN